jgi:hypothetical protein
MTTIAMPGISGTAVSVFLIKASYELTNSLEFCGACAKVEIELNNNVISSIVPNKLFIIFC